MNEEVITFKSLPKISLITLILELSLEIFVLLSKEPLFFDESSSWFGIELSVKSDTPSFNINEYPPISTPIDNINKATTAIFLIFSPPPRFW